MGENPLTYEAIDIFDRRTLACLGAWDVEMLMRMDDAVLSIRAGNPTQAEQAEAPPTKAKAIAAALRAKGADRPPRQEGS